MPSDNGLPGGLPAELWDYIGRMLPARAVVNLSMTNKAMAPVQRDTVAHHRGNFLFLGTLRDNRQNLLDQWRDQSLIREHDETWVTQQLDSMLTLLEIAVQSPLYPSTHDAAPPPGSVVGNGAEWTNFVQVIGVVAGFLNWNSANADPGLESRCHQVTTIAVQRWGLANCLIWMPGLR